MASSRAPPADRMEASAQQEIAAACDRMIVATEARKLDELFGHVADNNRGAPAGNGQLFLTCADARERKRA